MAFFYCEDGVAFQLATELRLLGHAATVADSHGQTGAWDEAHLWFATTHGWTLITHNRNDFRMLHRAWRLWPLSQPHAGILVLDQIPSRGAATMAKVIDDLARQTPSFTNSLYDWKHGTGWQLYP